MTIGGRALHRMVVAGGLVGAVASLVPVGSAHADTTIEAEIGVNGYAEPTDHAVVWIAVTADELIDGEVAVTRDGGALIVRQALQVPAGTTKEILLVTPTASLAEEVTVDVRDGDRLVATSDLRIRADPDTELVGVLPRLMARSDELPDQVTLPSGTGRAELAPLTLDVIDLGPTALEAYDTVVGAGDDLAALADDQRQSLLLWVHSGGRLLLDDGTGVTAVPSAWRPGPAGYAWAGRGEIRVLDGAAAAGRWTDIVEPSGPSSEYLDVGAETLVDPQQELADRAGVRLPSLMPLIIALAVYGLIIGPVVYLLLRRARRLTLGWIVIPVVAIATAGGIVVAGGRFRSSGNPATATFLETSPAGALGLTNTLSFSRSGGNEHITTPPRWQPDEATSPWVSFSGASATFTAESDGSGGLDVALESGQVATNAFTGPLDAENLTITAAMTADGTIAGSVTNGTEVALHDVAVFVGSDAVAIGTLAAGASADWTADAPDAIEMFSTRADRVWSTPFDGPRQEPGEQMAELGIWGAASLEWELFPTGLARVVGWTGQLPGPVQLADNLSSRTAISAITPVDPAGRPPEPATVRATIVRSPFGRFGNGMGGEQVYRYLVAPGSPTDALVVDGIDRNTFTEVAFWDGAAWVDHRLTADNDGDPIPVPPAAVRAGSLLLRVQIGGLGDPMIVPTLEAAP